MWTDDNLASKKFYPKFSFPAKSKKWVSRLRTSEKSMILCIRYLQSKYKARAVEMRVKPDASAVEEASKKAALAINICEELCNLVPMKSEQIEAWWQAWASGDANIDIELDGLLLERREDLDPRMHVPSLKGMCDVIARPVQRTEAEESGVTQSEYDLFAKQVEYDIQVFVTWQTKTSTANASRDHAAMKWKLEKRMEALKAADRFFDSCCRVCPWEKKVEKSIAECMNFRRQVILTKMGLEHGSQIPHICFLNASAPCVLSAQHLRNSVDVMSWALAENMQGVGVVVNPVFAYQRGHLHLEERALVDQLCSGNHNLDWSFAMIFGSKQDLRDMRPLIYNGRFVFASPLDLGKNVFWTCDLRRLQRTNEIPQLPGKLMREVENLAEDALPESSDASGRVKGAAKYAQLGPQCCHEVLTGLLTGSTYETVGPCLLLIDMHVMTGDMLQAFCQLRATMHHLFYLGFAEDQNEATYVEQIVKSEMADRFLSGTPLPTGEKIVNDVPGDLLEALPQPPRVNCLASWTHL